MDSIERIVIIGAGLAGARAAEGLRKDGYEGAITLVGDELERPYLRPPLSKEYLRGESEREAVFVHPQTFYAEHRIDLLTGTPVTTIDPSARQVVLADGPRIPFDRLLIATGSRPRRLTVEGADLPGVVSLRTAGEADALRAAASGAERVVIIGAGWIGCEVAASLRELGRSVTVVAPGAIPLERVLGPEIGTVYRDLHVAHGVELRPGTRATRIVGSGRVEAVETTAGERLPADLVVSGIGVEPRTELATAAGLAVGDGIEVDATLESSVPGIFAAGDVAAAWHPFYGRRIHSAHWANARFGGAAAAKSMLGTGAAYDRLPYFYSDQYDLSMEYRGFHAPGDRVVIRGSIADRSFLAFWLADGRVVAALNANTSGMGKPMEALIRSRAVVDVGALADPAVPLGELAGVPEPA